ncbi:MAG: fibronectin type III domain-containing protein [Gemmatimonadales bacterium]
MSAFASRIRTTAAALLAVAAVAGCSDNNKGGTGPAGLSAPAGLTVNQTSLTSASVSWTAVTGATGYLLQRADASNPGVFAQIGGGLINGTSYADMGLTQAVNYTYRVAAVNGSDTSAFSSGVVFATGVAKATINTNITANRTLYSDTTYTLSGYI